MRTRRAILLTFAAFASPALAQSDTMENDLHRAARANDTDRIPELLSSGTEIDARDGQRRTALLLATHAGAIEACACLLLLVPMSTPRTTFKTRPISMPPPRDGLRFCA